MNVVIVGCGRVGVQLALSLQLSHNISVVDPLATSFDRLGLHFSGRTVQGDGLDRETLQRAGIELADGVAAVTNSDNVNAIVARVAREIFHVKHVVARVYNPRRQPIYERLNVQIVSSSSWGAQRIEQLLLHPAMQSVSSAGSGEVQIYELSVPADWSGHKLTELVPGDSAIAVAVSREGRGLLPRADFILQADDVLQVSATDAGHELLSQRVHNNGERQERQAL